MNWLEDFIRPPAPYREKRENKDACFPCGHITISPRCEFIGESGCFHHKGCLIDVGIFISLDRLGPPPSLPCCAFAHFADEKVKLRDNVW